MRAADARLRGSVAGLLSGLFFGLGAPVSKLLLRGTGPLLLAGLLYLGAAAAFVLVRRSRTEASLRRQDVPVLAAAVLCGAGLGPPLMLWGLTRVSGLTGSLLLNLEAPFTMAMAVLLFREHLSRREIAAGALVVLGGALIGARGQVSGSIAGAAAIALACLCWAIDNNLNARLALKDPVQLLRIKAVFAGTLNLAVGFAAGERMGTARAVTGALALGTVSYGASFLLYLRAQRALGAARQAALFGIAPFAGAALAVPLLGDRPGLLEAAAAALMAVGVAVLIEARHSHVHTHEALEHEHAHVHDEHHRHAHEGPVVEPHAHPHRHASLTHDHPHVSDAHHHHKH